MVVAQTLRGPTGGYKNTPNITAQVTSISTGGATVNVDIRPPAGELWAPTFVKVNCTSDHTPPPTADTANMAIGMYDGSTFVRMEYAEQTGTKPNIVLPGAISFGSSASGPIYLTNSKYLRITMTVTGDVSEPLAYIRYHIIASVSKVI